tara:strand:- start:478 stop:780 length:303 start_codon:yes stop_codon:yes gene_type:complete
MKYEKVTQPPLYTYSSTDTESAERAAHRAAREQDNVYNPQHYKQGKVECIEAIQSALTEEEFRGYCKGNAMKYIWRERHKGGTESIEKAAWYLDYMMQCV